MPDYTVRELHGATYSGFYYVCMNALRGTIEGFYYATGSETPSQTIQLTYRNQRKFGHFQFR